MDVTFGMNLVERDRDRASRSVAIALEVLVDRVAVKAQHVAGCMNDPDVGLVGYEPSDVADLAAGVVKHGKRGVGQDADGPLEDGPAIHGQIVQTLFDGLGGGRNAASPRRPAQQVASRPVGAELVGDQALFRTAGPKQNRAGAVAEEGVTLLVGGIDHAAVAIAADDQSALAVARGHELRTDHQREDEAGTGGLDVERRAIQLEPILHQVGRGGKRHVRREGSQHQQVDIGEIAVGGLQASNRRLGAEVAGCLVRQGEAPFVNSGPVDDPLGIETQGILQVKIADHVVGDIAPRSKNLHAGERARSRGNMDLAIVHGQYATVSHREWSGITLSPRNTSSTNDSRELGYFGKGLTIMSYRYLDHSKAVMILGLLGWSRS